MRRPLRTGFTLVELLVVIAIIGVLVGLLLPAVQMAREAARRIQCSNNLKNLALGMANFETAKKRFPGYQEVFGSQGTGAATTGKVGSWVVVLLPFIEQQPLRDLWDDPTTNAAWLNQGRPSFSGGQLVSSGAIAEQFYPEIDLLDCPSDSQEEEDFGVLSYVVNTGFVPVGSNVAGLSPNYAGASSFPYPPAASTYSQRSANGVFVNLVDRVNGWAWSSAVPSFGSSKAVETDDIYDGASQTIGFSENLQAGSWEYFSGLGDGVSGMGDSARWWHGMVWLYRLDPGSTAPTNRPVMLGPDQVKAVNKINGDIITASMTTASGFEVGRPSSNHTSVANATMLDGSVVSLDEGMDYHVYQALMTPHSSKSDVPANKYVLKDDDFRQ